MSDPSWPGQRGVVIGASGTGDGQLVFLTPDLEHLLFTRSVPRELEGRAVSFGCALAYLPADACGNPDRILVGAPSANADAAGCAVVLATADGALLRVHEGTVGGDGFGVSVETLGDRNGDGVADYAVGAPERWIEGSGYVRVFSGADGAVLFEFRGEEVGDGFGGSLSAGRVSGAWQLAVGATGRSRSRNAPGYVQVLGESGSYLLNGAEFFARDEADPEGVVGPWPANAFGEFVEFVSDLDGDGEQDLAIVDGHAWPSDSCSSIYLVSGRTHEELWRFSVEAERGVGSPLAGIRDLDGDGVRDLVAGCWRRSTTQDVWLIGGADGGRLRAPAEVWAKDTLEVSAICEIESDSSDRVDILVGSIATGSPSQSGKVQLMSARTGEVRRSVTLNEALALPRLDAR